MVWIEKAVFAELANAGYQVAPAKTDSGQAQIVVSGTVSEFLTDITMEGFATRLRVTFTVARGGTTSFNREFLVNDGGSSLTASDSDYEETTTEAVTKLMRRAMPDLIAAIDAG